VRAYRFCPHCGTAYPGPPDGVRQACDACGEATYLTPKPAACGVVLDRGGRVLLGRRARDPAAGLWDVLGGFLEPGETPEAALVRELLEETGLVCTVGRYLGGFPDMYGEGGDATLNLAYQCHVGEGEPRAADDVAELAWFAPSELPPPDQFAFPNSVAILEAWRASI
jgi:NADH pyrophosphatase NudC (nudix superfamily)